MSWRRTADARRQSTESERPDVKHSASGTSIGRSALEHPLQRQSAGAAYFCVTGRSCVAGAAGACAMTLCAAGGHGAIAGVAASPPAQLTIAAET